MLCDYESENRELRETCSSDIEQMQPLAEDDFLLDVNGGILDLRPSSQQGNRWNLRNRKDQRKILWLIRKKHPKLVIGSGKTYCSVQSCTMNRSGEELGSCTTSVAMHRSSLSRA